MKKIKKNFGVLLTSLNLPVMHDNYHCLHANNGIDHVTTHTNCILNKVRVGKAAQSFAHKTHQQKD